jgi:hypothetical protein
MIWKADHAELISWLEYDFWMRNKLPMGWMILSEPSGSRT